MRKRLLSAIAGAALLVGTAGAMAPAAQASHRPAPCSYKGWNNGLKNATNATEGSVNDIDAGRHRCYERIVVRRGGDPWVGYDVRYVAAAYTDGEGAYVPMGSSNKILQVMVDSPSYNHFGYATNPNVSKKHLRTWTNAAHTKWQTINFGSYKTVKVGKWLGSFEGTSTFALGLKPDPKATGKKPLFRVFTANKHKDLVIDVKAFNPDLKN
jgi:hypothetical protein